MNYRLTLVAICAIITLGSTSCAVDSVPGIEGTIFRFSRKTTFCYTPNSGRTVNLTLERDNLEPYIACRGPGDTIICMIFNGVAEEFYSDGKLFGDRAAGKYIPFATRFELVPSIADTTFGIRQLDYDSISKKYLLTGRPGGSRSGGLYVLDLSFDVGESLSPLIDRLLPEEQNSLSNAFFLSNGNILFGKGGGDRAAVYELDTVMQTCTRVSFGSIQAVSNARDLATITTYGSISLYDINTKTLSQLPLKTRGKVRYIRAYCFSPNDRYIAYSVRENDFKHTARLHIYDLQKRKNYKTVSIGFGPLLWLPIEPPAEIFETHKWW